MIKKVMESPLAIMVIPLSLGAAYIGVQERWPYVMIIPFINVLIVLLSIILVTIHNKRFPKDTMRLWTLIPYELREEDEGMQYYTYRATRKVYIFFALALPFSLLLYVIFGNLIKYSDVILLCLLYTAQLLIFWLEIRKAYVED
ncbi:hypothetical protein HNO89_002171 [Sporosarcina luteola]|nr:hypothetical protein [Sporosarcina luteola]